MTCRESRYRVAILTHFRSRPDCVAVKKPRNDYSPFVLAIEWSSRITTIALEMVVPTLLGYWLDRRLGSGVVFLLVGVVVGFSVALLSLLRLARSSRDDDRTE